MTTFNNFNMSRQQAKKNQQRQQTSVTTVSTGEFEDQVLAHGGANPARPSAQQQPATVVLNFAASTSQIGVNVASTHPVLTAAQRAQQALLTHYTERVKIGRFNFGPGVAITPVERERNCIFKMEGFTAIELIAFNGLIVSNQEFYTKGTLYDGSLGAHPYFTAVAMALKPFLGDEGLYRCYGSRTRWIEAAASETRLRRACGIAMPGDQTPNSPAAINKMNSLLALVAIRGARREGSTVINGQTIQVSIPPAINTKRVSVAGRRVGSLPANFYADGIGNSKALVLSTTKQAMQPEFWLQLRELGMPAPKSLSGNEQSCAMLNGTPTQCGFSAGEFDYELIGVSRKDIADFAEQFLSPEFAGNFTDKFFTNNDSIITPPRGYASTGVSRRKQPKKSRDEDDEDDVAPVRKRAQKRKRSDKKKKQSRRNNKKRDDSDDEIDDHEADESSESSAESSESSDSADDSPPPPPRRAKKPSTKKPSGGGSHMATTSILESNRLHLALGAPHLHAALALRESIVATDGSHGYARAATDVVASTMRNQNDEQFTLSSFGTSDGMALGASIADKMAPASSPQRSNVLDFDDGTAFDMPAPQNDNDIFRSSTSAPSTVNDDVTNAMFEHFIHADKVVVPVSVPYAIREQVRASLAGEFTTLANNFFKKQTLFRDWFDRAKLEGFASQDGALLVFGITDVPPATWAALCSPLKELRIETINNFEIGIQRGFLELMLTGERPAKLVYDAVPPADRRDARFPIELVGAEFIDVWSQASSIELAVRSTAPIKSGQLIGYYKGDPVRGGIAELDGVQTIYMSAGLSEQESINVYCIGDIDLGGGVTGAVSAEGPKHYRSILARANHSENANIEIGNVYDYNEGGAPVFAKFDIPNVGTELVAHYGAAYVRDMERFGTHVATTSTLVELPPAPQPTEPIAALPSPTISTIADRSKRLAQASKTAKFVIAGTPSGTVDPQSLCKSMLHNGFQHPVFV